MCGLRDAASNAGEVLANEYLIGTTRTSTRRVVPPTLITPGGSCVFTEGPQGGPGTYTYRYLFLFCSVLVPVRRVCVHTRLQRKSRGIFKWCVAVPVPFHSARASYQHARAHIHTHARTHTHTHTRYSHTHATHTHTLLTAGSQHALRNACRQDVAV